MMKTAYKAEAQCLNNTEASLASEEPVGSIVELKL
jgi:hypothetical protein